MNQEQEIKVEASIPVQSRVDIRALAEMVLYWDGEGVYIKTMSQLVNWTVDLCSQILKLNDRLPEEVDSVIIELLTCGFLWLYGCSSLCEPRHFTQVGRATRPPANRRSHPLKHNTPCGYLSIPTARTLLKGFSHKHLFQEKNSLL